LGKLLLSDAQIGDIVGAGGLITIHTYNGISQSEGEVYSDPDCAEAFSNTMWTAYNGSGYTGAVGRGVGDPHDEQHDYSVHYVDEGVVSFPTADAASRFVVRQTLAWDRCSDADFSITDPGPQKLVYRYTLGNPAASGDIATVVNSVEGAGDRTHARALTSRANVVIDVDVLGPAMTADKAVAVVNAIGEKMPR
jgi:serine/threonine-protein kinase